MMTSEVISGNESTAGQSQKLNRRNFKNIFDLKLEKKNSEKVEIIQKGFTLRAVAVALPIMLIAFFLNLLTTARYPPVPIGATPEKIGGWELVFIIIIATQLLGPRISKRFTPQEYAVMFAMFWFGLGVSLFISAFPGVYIWPVGVEPWKSTFPSEWIPDFWTAKDPAAVEGILKGLKPGETIPWGLWIEPMIFYMLTILGIYLSQFWVSVLLRKVWIEIESLPFPGQRMSSLLIMNATSYETGSERPNLFNFRLTWTKLFWVGFFVAFLHLFPDMAAFLVPVPKWVFAGWTRIDVKPYLASYLPGATLWLFYNPAFVAMLYFASLDFLASTALSWFVFRILYPVVGVVTGILPYSPGWEAEAYLSTDRGPIHSGTMVDLGFALGIGLFTIVINWKFIAKSFKAAFGRAKQEEEEIPSTLIWIGIIIFNLLLLGLMTANGMPFVLAFIWLVLLQITSISDARKHAETGDPGGLMHRLGVAWRPVIWDIGSGLGIFTKSPAETREAFATFFQTQAITGYPSFHFPIEGITAGCFKVGTDLKTSHMDILKGMLLAFILCTVIAVPTFIWMGYNYGLTNLTSNTLLVRSTSVSMAAGKSYTFTKTPPYDWGGGLHWPWMAIGIIVCGLIMYGRTVFPWFWLNPIGIFFGTSTMWWNIGGNSLFAFVLKALTVKLGGSRAYERYGIPLATGFLISYGFFLAFIQVVSALLKF
jgi:hypothetical protein